VWVKPMIDIIEIGGTQVFSPFLPGSSEGNSVVR
jgi:hypothetical protein